MNRILLALLLLLVGAGLVAGFLTVGGPGYARLEKQDAERMRDLHDLGAWHRCLATAGMQADLPRDCPTPVATPDRTDPATGAPYLLRRTGPRSFEVCATFATRIAGEERIEFAQLRWDGQEGCLRYEGLNPDADWGF
ncbi:MAG: hypothetical protein P1U53_14710 [Sulfitobacter sp.]|nr:hypothetical protein [Sulfitobacter sp.]